MIRLFTDASTKGNPGPSGAGILIIGENYRKQLSLPLKILSNHEAEFEAVYQGLLYISKEYPTSETIILYTDSKIVAQTIDKNYSKHPSFQHYLEKINTLIAAFPLFICQWIPEKQNKGADHLARQGLQKLLKREGNI